MSLASFGSSSFDICITELTDGLIHVLHAEEYPRLDYNTMVDTVLELINKYRISTYNDCRIYADGANPEFISSVKSRLSEEESDIDFLDYIKILKANNPGQNEDSLIRNNMLVIPTYFNQKEKVMLAHLKKLMEYQNVMCHKP